MHKVQVGNNALKNIKGLRKRENYIYHMDPDLDGQSIDLI